MESGRAMSGYGLNDGLSFLTQQYLNVMTHTIETMGISMSKSVKPNHIKYGGLTKRAISMSIAINNNITK
jgi:hypothetical protein